MLRIEFRIRTSTKKIKGESRLEIRSRRSWSSTCKVEGKRRTVASRMQNLDSNTLGGWIEREREHYRKAATASTHKPLIAAHSSSSWPLWPPAAVVARFPPFTFFQLDRHIQWASRFLIGANTQTPQRIHTHKRQSTSCTQFSFFSFFLGSAGARRPDTVGLNAGHPSGRFGVLSDGY